MPREGAIEYAEASRFNQRSLWNTGFPAFAGNDTEVEARAHNIPARAPRKIVPPPSLIATLPESV